MTDPFPQYAKTTDPKVLEAMAEAEASHSVFMEYVRHESYRLTGAIGNIYHAGSAWTGRGIVGVRTSAARAEDLPGQWKRPNGGVREPFKNNPIRQVWKENAHPYMPIPGRRQVEWGEHYMGPGTLFVQGGVAYSGYGFIPRDPAVKGSGVWEEIRASEFMAAAEAYNDAIDEAEKKGDNGER